MKTYLVGGAVRDRLLGLPVVDRDWVVVGSTAEEMLAAGYKPVGRDFPVFLHPQSHDEYALARTERKTGSGYRGFVVHAEKDVTLEEDLIRRDLTINAIAETAAGDIIDPHQGCADLDNRILRHVSEAFEEDPVRVLRVARFAARFHLQGFTIAPETLALMQKMVTLGEVDALVAERVWQELVLALNSASPRVFFEVLKECGALEVLLPELDALFGIPQPAQHHPEIDCGIHTLMVLEEIKKQSDLNVCAFAAICHDFGKALTPAESLPHHYGHEKAGIEPVKALCTRLKVPNEFSDLALLCCEYHLHCHRALELTPAKLTQTLAALDVLRKPERFEQFLQVCEADARGRQGFENRDYPQGAFLRGAKEAFSNVNAATIAANTNEPKNIKNAVHRARLNAIKIYINSLSSHPSGNKPRGSNP